MQLRPLFLAALCSLSLLHAEDIPLTDSTVVPGERVGPIERGMTLTGLKSLVLGTQEKIVYTDIPGAEGETTPGAILFKGTDRELQVLFNPEGDEKEILEVHIIGKGWKFPGGLKRGMSVAEVQKVNEKPYKVAGFDWDYGGYADFSGGKLEGKISIRFGHGDKEIDSSLSGDHMISSEDEKLRKAKVTVEQISVMFPVKEDIPKEADDSEAAKPDAEEKPDKDEKETKPAPAKKDGE